MSIAFVLSGGGNRGPLQVGALQSLLEHAIRPDMFVGTSAGAINSGFMAAAGPTIAALPTLAEAWHRATRKVVYPGNVFTWAWRVLSGADSFFPAEGMRRLITDNLPAGVTTFGQLRRPCYLTTVDMRSRRLYLFGEDPAAPLLDAILASSSIPCIHPPVEYHGLQLVDGGVAAAAPAGVAMDKGATVICSVNVGLGEELQPRVGGVIPIFMRTLDAFVAQSLFDDPERAAAEPAIELHHIHIGAFHDLPFNDFDHIDAMIAAGKQATDDYLAHPQPSFVQPPTPSGPAMVVAGAREIAPRRLTK
jgi:NTE family protein